MNETTPMELDLVQLALIATETGETVDRLTHRFGDEVVLDDIGKRAVPASVARRFFTERAEQKARQLEAAQRHREDLAQRTRPVYAGIPAKEGLDPVAAMTSQDPAYTTPSQDFGVTRGNPRQELMDEVFAEGRRRDAERKAQAEARKKAREENQK